MQIENWHIVLFLACIGTLYKIAFENEAFYKKMTSTLTKIICVLSAFTAGYFVRGETEIELILYITFLMLTPVVMLGFWFISFTANGIKCKK